MPQSGSNKVIYLCHNVSKMKYLEVILISGVPVEPEQIRTYKRKIGDTEITVENIIPQFPTEEEHLNTKSRIMQSLYEVFSKYEEDC